MRVAGAGKVSCGGPRVASSVRERPRRSKFARPLDRSRVFHFVFSFRRSSVCSSLGFVLVNFVGSLFVGPTSISSSWRPRMSSTSPPSSDSSRSLCGEVHSSKCSGRLLVNLLRLQRVMNEFCAVALDHNSTTTLQRPEDGVKSPVCGRGPGRICGECRWPPSC